MFNPFKAVGNAIAKAGQAIGKAIGGGLEKTGGALTKAGGKMKGPKAPPAAPKTPPAAPKAPARQATRVMPTVTPPAARPPEKKLPPSMIKGGRTGGMTRDEAILGADSDMQRALVEAVKEFESEHSQLGLSKATRDFLEQPSFAAILDQYASGGGFDSAQWENGMSNVRNIRITRTDDGIDIIFNADFDMGGDYDLGGRSPYASF